MDADSIAHLVLERAATADPAAEPRFRLGAAGYGPTAALLAERTCEQIRAWSNARTAEPTITASPAGTPDPELPAGAVINKQSTRLVTSS